MDESNPGTDRELFRHALATLAYRGAKVVRGAPAGFGDFRIGPTSRSPVQILGHICDVLDWGLAMAEGEHRWAETRSEIWQDQVDRFYRALAAFDDYLASDHELGFPITQLLQGPVADSLTHIGQLAMLRRLAGSPVKGENYAKAEIMAGAVGTDQPPARLEFE
jgi:hypothetical protein